MSLFHVGFWWIVDEFVGNSNELLGRVLFCETKIFCEYRSQSCRSRLNRHVISDHKAKHDKIKKIVI